MANPPKPLEVKRRIGNPGKRALPSRSKVTALKPASGIPEPLRPLGPEGRHMWDRVWTSGAVWISPATDIEAVQLLAETVDERAALRVIVMSGEGDWRDRPQLRLLDDSIRRFLSALGFTPTDRTRLGVGEVRQQSALETLQSKRAKRAN